MNRRKAAELGGYGLEYASHGRHHVDQKSACQARIQVPTDTHADDGVAKTQKQEGRAAGATGWIVKPFQPDQLLSVVGRVVR